MQCDVPRMLGLPIYVLRYPPDEAWSSTNSKFENIGATSLHLRVHGSTAILKDANGKMVFRDTLNGGRPKVGAP